MEGDNWNLGVTCQNDALTSKFQHWLR